MADHELPPLPECDSYCTHADLHDYDVWNADQMREYALAAIAALNAKQAPGMAVQALAGEIIEALLADEKDGGYDLTAGMFGQRFSDLVRRWAALEYAAIDAMKGDQP